ncbi:Rieske (2Fe-2S) protein [Streptomyces sp. NPDC020422]|uniref:Rieske (2Fe-2S) protein n=1 Tax=Streptomyces sp. NPDC020422 TaxID=3365074 RepID=UPI0037BA3731
MTADALSRRATLLAGAALVSGCASGSGGSESPPTGASSAAVLARTADIPVGGGRVFEDEKVVVTQPVAGRFKAFSAICTHQGCTVNKVADGTIDCPCHGSKYRITDGSVAAGPAPRRLPDERINVSDGTITLA